MHKNQSSLSYFKNKVVRQLLYLKGKTYQQFLNLQFIIDFYKLIQLFQIQFIVSGQKLFSNTQISYSEFLIFYIQSCQNQGKKSLSNQSQSQNDSFVYKACGVILFINQSNTKCQSDYY
ncbi:hypothetical protein IMG5_055140 [Ichthyophthirius multifiliis]|uniref:Uncharacterized protein n=1 Tax=Ichthyophthirius multifiliis TaxID=5932 RepID=G0QN42_ICHMU|nr:hypothetical protein IMG5_055140 [Ichthyophthirius multifiliis]EGR33371.1 hypothetical protein IMG5_055140 [Ichthyophthirius multifiliis]|eukprot:XP_004037357.1 hypothetical protein IMG5_055140 [Ichthyophthirius multifiliis]